MTDIPIIFSAPMVRALLDGRKTQTRRLAWRSGPGIAMAKDGSHRVTGQSPWQKVRPGDRLWVRETWENFIGGGEDVSYRATVNEDTRGSWTVEEIAEMRWRPAIHMPRWASRLTLVVTATKVERLQQISEADAKAEGVQLKVDQHGNGLVEIGCKHSPLHYIDPKLHGKGDKAVAAAWTHRCHFAAVWDDLHGDSAWDANPEVVALTFTVQRANIDQIERKAIPA